MSEDDDDIPTKTVVVTEKDISLARRIRGERDGGLIDDHVKAGKSPNELGLVVEEEKPQVEEVKSVDNDKVKEKKEGSGEGSGEGEEAREEEKEKIEPFELPFFPVYRQIGPGQYRIGEMGPSHLLVKEHIALIFQKLNPFDLLRVSQTCFRWRRISLLLWHSTQRMTIVEYFKMQIQDYYIPTRRLEYLDRNYETMELSVRWPKIQPIRIVNYVHRKSALEKVKRVLWDTLGIKFTSKSREKEEEGELPVYLSEKRKVWFEGNLVSTSFSCTNIVDETFVKKDMEVFGLCLIWIVDQDDDLWASEKFSLDMDMIQRRKKIVSPAFNWKKSKMIAGESGIILVCHPCDFDGKMVLHCKRGNLPFNAPTLEVFEENIPATMKEKAVKNFENLLKNGTKKFEEKEREGEKEGKESSTNKNNNNNN